MRSIIFVAVAWAVLAVSCSDSGNPGGSGGSGGLGAAGGDAGCSSRDDCEQAGASGTAGTAGESGAAGAPDGGAAGSGTITGTTIPELGAPVTVHYDARDIPNIRCRTIADCLAVQGYIQARDRLFPMDYLRHSARGRLSELIGVAGLEQDVQLRTLFVTRAGHRLEQDLANAMDPATRTLLSAFVGGINAYLKTLRAEPERLP
ncbi:MAG TPA: penicillin acylase family protein, partial [Polyangiaceae bacterium]|nr:penicillin acylase family protein [Polyangiaceae bacterium]